ncbi:hypothetical protein [Bacillus atrophaeus]|uniref:hypothetical protein n=1 Tax=Bacillus atrophaeus TaxID=1452 RepID=UPI002DB8D038|nr:hypothetical protein [Bacillus atrophaeus]MEC1900978.1 hypothetical protein [Bacillus atrophaeus]MEC2396143.1 hypothetical protein [Bacillus atrophaeus]MED4437315.1 hypothetical protein [Bacillus atrophaeus]MED4567059.1 hypothetical protein [Bacillus atrophaeus]MED4573381.1 hypothetical protein [Bacillus atrophaeus]
MIITLKVFLLLIAAISLLGVIGEEKDMELRKQLTAICLASIIGAVITFAFL